MSSNDKPLIPPQGYDQTDELARKIWDDQVEKYGRMTNMKQTLAHSGPALRALMEWYPLRDAVAGFLGDRLTTIFAHSVSQSSDCLICSTFFRRILKESGEDPDNLVLDDWEQSVVSFGQHITRNGLHGDQGRPPADLMSTLLNRLSSQQLVELTSFATIMIATNLFNNVIGVTLDDYLTAFRKDG